MAFLSLSYFREKCKIYLESEDMTDVEMEDAL